MGVGVCLVFYDLVDFLERVGSWDLLLFEVRREPVENGIFQRHVLRLYGVDDEGNIVVYEDSRELRAWDEASAKTLYNEWLGIVEKLGAKPGRIER